MADGELLLPLHKSRDPFPWALAIALLLHLLLLTGIDFQERDRETGKQLQIELVLEPTPSPPKRAPFLAQAQSEGGGKGLPKPVETLPKPGAQAQKAPDLRQKPPSAGNPPRKTSPERPPIKPVPALKEAPAEPDRRLDPRALLRQIQEVSGTVALKESLGVRPIRSIRARRHVAAAYELAWQRRVEAVGSRHYPKEARDRSAAVLVSVWVRADGHVERIKILRSSGVEAIDRAVYEIVELAAPFPPFPEELRREARILEITRLWRFEAGSLRGE